MVLTAAGVQTLKSICSSSSSSSSHLLFLVDFEHNHVTLADENSRLTEKLPESGEVSRVHRAEQRCSADTRVLLILTANDLAMEVLSDTVADGWLTTVFMCDTERRRWKTLNIPPIPLAMAQLFGKRSSYFNTGGHLNRCGSAMVLASEEKQTRLITCFRLNDPETRTLRR